MGGRLLYFFTRQLPAYLRQVRCYRTQQSQRLDPGRLATQPQASRASQWELCPTSRPHSDCAPLGGVGQSGAAHRLQRQALPGLS